MTAALLILTLGLQQAPEAPVDHLFELELGTNDAILDGRGPSQRVEYTSQHSGRLFVWAASDALDPFVRVERSGGELLAEDDDMGGGTTAYVEVELEPGDGIVVTVASAELGGSGPVELHLVACSETEATRAAAAAAAAELGEIRQQIAERKVREALERLDAQIDGLLAVPGRGASSDVSDALRAVGGEAGRLSAWPTAARALGPPLEFVRIAMPETARARLDTQMNFANTLVIKGNHEGLQRALGLYVRTLDGWSRRGQPQHEIALQCTANLVVVLNNLELDEQARDVGSALLATREATVGPDHPQTLMVKHSLSEVLQDLQEYDEARALLEEVVSARVRVLGEDHEDTLASRLNLGILLGEIGSRAAAREQVLRAYTGFVSALPPEHYYPRVALFHLGRINRALGRYEEALEQLETVLAFERELHAEDHDAVLETKTELAEVLLKTGRHDAVLQLREEILEARSSRLGTEHPLVERDRLGLSKALQMTDDLPAARELAELVLESRKARLGEGHVDTETAAQHLATILLTMGEDDVAVPMLEKVAAARAARLPSGHAHVIDSRIALARASSAVGRHEQARSLCLVVLEELEGLPDHHNDVIAVLAELRGNQWQLGEHAAARETSVRLAEAIARTAPADEWDRLATQRNLALAELAVGDVDAAVEAMDPVVSALVESLPSKVLAWAPREIATRSARYAAIASMFHSLAGGPGRFDPRPELEPRGFTLVEVMRSLDLVQGRLLVTAREDGRIEALRASVRSASDELARVAGQRATAERLSAARAERDRAQRELTRSLTDGVGLAALMRAPTHTAIAATLEPNEAAIAVWRYRRLVPDRRFGTGWGETENLCAYVVRPSGSLARVELGLVEEIERAVTAWRSRVAGDGGRGVAVVEGVEGVEPESSTVESVEGAALAELTIGRLLPHLDGVSRVVVALDDVLHTVALDALPLGAGLVGDVFEVEVRPTLRELLTPLGDPAGDDVLLVMGNVDYDGWVGDDDDSPSLRGGATAKRLRNGALAAGFGALPATGEELRGVFELHEESRTDASSERLEDQSATREALIESAPAARWLHLATHGWVVDERQDSTRGRGSSSGDSALLSSYERLAATSPMVLAGLALAGANAPPDDLGRVRGTITAEEIATLDLSNCELAVLSACDTSVGVRRAGQGVASLQKALHMAGARSAITSLWKVPDEATKDLMLDFYRRLWIAGKPKGRALWEAKMALRDKGHPPSDWAGWVLSGEWE